MTGVVRTVFLLQIEPGTHKKHQCPDFLPAMLVTSQCGSSGSPSKPVAIERATLLVQGDSPNQWVTASDEEWRLYAEARAVWAQVLPHERAAVTCERLTSNEHWEVIELCGRFHMVARDKPARTGRKRTFWEGPQDAPEHYGRHTAYVIPPVRDIERYPASDDR